jgi:hypothetical protein
VTDNKPPVEALGEVLASCIMQVGTVKGIDKYECRMCDADISSAPFTHEPDCEYQIVRTWLESVVGRVFAA